MKWLYKLERKFGRYAIKGMITHIIALNVIVFLLGMIYSQEMVISKLVLEPNLVLRGEVWRLITFIFIPPTWDPIWLFFGLYFFYMLGTGLENAWGSFKLNIYYIVGMIATTIAAFITGVGATGVYLNTSLFLAFAYIYPNFEILLFFIVPVKVKYLAWLEWAFLLYTVIVHDLPLKLAAIASVINYLIFFGKEHSVDIKRRIQVYRNRRRFQKNMRR